MTSLINYSLNSRPNFDEIKRALLYDHKSLNVSAYINFNVWNCTKKCLVFPRFSLMEIWIVVFSNIANFLPSTRSAWATVTQAHSEAPQKKSVYAQLNNWGRTRRFFDTILYVKTDICRYIRTLMIVKQSPLFKFGIKLFISRVENRKVPIFRERRWGNLAEKLNLLSPLFRLHVKRA